MTQPVALIVVTHLLGVGHFVRAVAIGRALAHAGWRVTVATGGKRVANVDINGCDLVQLPPVHCVGADFRTLLRPDGALADGDYLSQRREILLEHFDRIAPDVLIVELFPFGRRRLAKEFEALLEHARAAQKRPAILCSIRDVLHPPGRADKVAQTEARLARFYDAVLFHGDEVVVPLGASWPVTPSLQRRLRPTGYLRDGERSQTAPSSHDGSGEIIVSGGGSSAGLNVSRVAIAAARLTPTLRWRVLVGHGVAETDFLALRASPSENAIVERARPDFPALLARAAASVSQAGYNTVLDLAAAQARAILIPFAGGEENEQGMRAARLAERGLARMIEERDLTAASLAATVKVVLVSPKPGWSTIRLDGTARTAVIIDEEHARAARRNRAWRRLTETLAALRRAGRVAPIWLRDDDAIEMSDALRVFLDRLAKHQIPAALAAIPSKLSEGFASEISRYPDARLLVHGWAHLNHALAPEKKCEFPGSRSLREMEKEACGALARLKMLAPAAALPVFAPPWNRMAPELQPRLAECGYAGLSMFSRKRRLIDDGAPSRRDTHWDPIAWRQGGGLLPEGELLDGLCDLLEQELSGDALELIGLLTHHLVHDGWIARFLEEVLSALADSGAVRFLSADEVFGVTPSSSHIGF